jgi:hypothetical protein
VAILCPAARVPRQQAQQRRVEGRVHAPAASTAAAPPAAPTAAAGAVGKPAQVPWKQKPHDSTRMRRQDRRRILLLQDTPQARASSSPVSAASARGGAGQGRVGLQRDERQGATVLPERGDMVVAVVRACACEQ